LGLLCSRQRAGFFDLPIPETSRDGEDLGEARERSAAQPLVALDRLSELDLFLGVVHLARDRVAVPRLPLRLALRRDRPLVGDCERLPARASPRCRTHQTSSVGLTPATYFTGGSAPLSFKSSLLMIPSSTHRNFASDSRRARKSGLPSRFFFFTDADTIA